MTTDDLSTFTDATGCRWCPVIGDDFAARAKRELKVNIPVALSLSPPATVARLVGDPATAVGLIWLAVEHQAAAEGIRPESFTRLLAGPRRDLVLYERAVYALLMAIAQAFPLSRFGRSGHLLPQAIATFAGDTKWPV